MDRAVTSRRPLPALLALLALLFAAACERAHTEQVDGGRVMSFETRTVRIATGADTVVVHAEVARSAEQRTMGLMERASLAPDSGMLFMYGTEQPGTSGFWMYRTRIPLDIAFADSTGTINAILTMQPCAATLAAGCPSYNPNVGYRYALEVNAGFFARRGVRIGSRIVLAAK